MFRPDSNRDRTDYSGILMPPDGYRLDRAVGTTYSLDLEALTAVAICLGLSEETDSKLMQNPIGMLNALQKVSDKIVLFCEAGQIKVPTKPTALSILLEKMVVEVALPKDRQLGRYPSFHPKTWVLAYVNADGDKKYRFVVMSRNLTFDRSWDISFAMDSSKNVRQKKKTQPICDFLDYLVMNVHNTSNNAGKKRNLIRGLCADIKDVSFSLDSKIFGEDFEVLPLGIGKNAYRMQEDILFCKERGNANSTFNELVVMSPFLSESVIADFNLTDRALSDCKRTLVTRRSELGKLKASDVDNFTIYALKDEIIDGEEEISDELADKKKQDIHAKIYLRRLRIEEKDDLFKVIYICSNQNIANQNIRKLNVTGKNAIGSVSDTRLSMQHLKITEQENDPQIKEGFIQLIPLTPETSFRMTTGGGSVQERALMYAILRRMPDFKGHVTSLEKFMIMDAVKAWDGWAKWNFENRVAECEKMTKGVYPQNVIEKILNYQEYESIRDMLLNHLHERRYNKQLTYSNYYVMNKLRVMFARISVSMLEPDLVIMDEFQRFKFLLSSDDSELGILAHSFLSGHDTRVLLLSATPYKLYSTLEEIDENQLDEHYAEFFQVMNFLFDDEVKDIKFKEVWKNYSHALSELKAGDSAIIRMKELAENAMYQGVSRTERISVMDSGDYTDDSSVKHHLQIDENDINSYIQMSRLLSKTDSNHSLPVDYAKSCPYLMSFMKKYKIKEQIEKYYIKHPDEFGSEREQCLLWLNRNKINKYDELPKTNARLEALKEKAFTGGAEKYLWIPPSLPYYEMQGAYKNSKGFSKILVFSAWEMVPRMIGALVSYEAERLTVGKLVHQIKNQDKKNTGYFADGSRRYPVARLRFNVSNGEVRGMSLFALLYPSKTLSDMYLPIESLNNHESLEVIEKSVRLKLKEKLAIIEEKYGDSGNNKEDARWYYLAPMLMDGVIYAKHWIEDIVWEMNTDEEDTTSEVRSSSKDKRNKGFIAHIDKLRSYLDAPEEIHLGRKPEDLLETLVNMVLGSPAICIYRSNGRSTARATSLAKVFVNNFNLPESTAIIDLAYGRCRDDNSHWQNVLKYCKDGCFQAMIDEYIHMLKETAGFQSDGNQYQIVHDIA